MVGLRFEGAGGSVVCLALVLVGRSRAWGLGFAGLLGHNGIVARYYFACIWARILRCCI